MYELENEAADPDGVIDAAMRTVRGTAGAHVLDIGCGDGYHLARFARDADRVTGV
ncbi:SAM-dependent methyltransferase, partial [Streptomonospora algeriensis]